jgi:hypothetical protein
MASTLVPQIQDHLARYLANETTLDEFKDWLVGATWDIEQRGDSESEDLTYEIKLRLAEHSGGYCTEDDLRRLLRPLAVPSPMPVVP